MKDDANKASGPAFSIASSLPLHSQGQFELPLDEVDDSTARPCGLRIVLGRHCRWDLFAQDLGLGFATESEHLLQLASAERTSERSRCQSSVIPTCRSSSPADRLTSNHQVRRRA